MCSSFTNATFLSDITLSSEVVVEKGLKVFINTMKTQFKKSRRKNVVDDVKNKIDRYLLNPTCDNDETFFVSH